MKARVSDDRGRAIALAREPERVVSLVPSDSYTLARLGLGDRLVGRTEYCVEPAELSRIATVGGTKNADVERIVALRPDLVIANQEENRRVDIERLEGAGLCVLLSFPHTVAEGLAHVERLLALFPSAKETTLLDEGKERYRTLSQRQVAPVRTFVPIWMDPLMTVNAATFISDAIELCGGENAFADRERRYPLSADLGKRPPAPTPAERDVRYPRVTLDEVVARKPELVLLPDEPHEFTEADADVFRALDIPAAPDRVHFCNGRDLMWYGLRAVEGLDRLVALVDEARC